MQDMYDSRQTSNFNENAHRRLGDRRNNVLIMTSSSFLDALSCIHRSINDCDKYFGTFALFIPKIRDSQWFQERNQV